MTPAQADALRLWMRGYTHDAIAEQLSISREAASMRLREARRALGVATDATRQQTARAWRAQLTADLLLVEQAFY